MVIKRTATSATAPVRAAKAKAAPAAASSRTARAADPVSALLSERDALRLELSVLRTRVDALTALRADLEARLENAVAAIQKLIGR